MHFPDVQFVFDNRVCMRATYEICPRIDCACISDKLYVPDQHVSDIAQPSESLYESHVHILDSASGDFISRFQSDPGVHIDAAPDGSLFMTTHELGVVQLKTDGTRLATIGQHGNSRLGEFLHPHGVAVIPWGTDKFRLYVTDRARHIVQVFELPQ